MVLQRAPAQAVLWGYTHPGSVVVTTMVTMNKQQVYTSTAEADGTWRVTLDAIPASDTPHNFSFASTVGEEFAITNVLFGDVYICSGQSNMQSAVANLADDVALQEAALADTLPLIRIFTVARASSKAGPLDDLETVLQPWAVASAQSVAGGGEWDFFSAVCWIFGREVFATLGSSVPIGLISSNFGGSLIESWTTPTGISACGLPNRHVNNLLYNTMIHPYSVGPMALAGFVWYQGESNVDYVDSSGELVSLYGGAERYRCTFPEMIRQWREVFAAPEAYFGFVQLSTWCGDGESIAEMRTTGQMAALALPKVGYATQADRGGRGPYGCDIHPEELSVCARRLATSALYLQYGLAQHAEWESPSFASQLATNSPPSMEVSLSNVSAAGLEERFPRNYATITTSAAGISNCSTCRLCSAARGKCSHRSVKCAWAQLLFADGQWVNATISIAPGGGALTLTPVVAPTGSSCDGAPVGSRYGWAALPMMSLYDKKTGLPVLPWSETT
eukprot:CAMPEP_0183334410 /NCGR_PEP_ID=MMETSP0164_2-20130417/3020_1 /TAXON_ID=221442 /ORGANISM="Coccolithus pelagicus ssp braarudi, Strain PLY182g" /LENGTH=504 /DNA_ID=CAMNT_0025503537 /DNA_START=229 /DNA_END=1743 /DNA_ORIENTATION=+